MSEDPPDRSPSLPQAPYVGLRPFDRDEREVFQGRDEDVVLLSNKVFASPLTILYGPSGVGKSSLLRTLFIEQVEKQDARAVYFDDWRSEDPTAILKAELVKTATKVGVPDAGRGAPNLIQLAQLLVAVDHRTLVLILDQFEEFFTAHRSGLEPLRTELSGLVRIQRLDVRVLISLREEHLAALEPFRMAFVDLFQSTYRLEPLALDKAREAIVVPAGKFGVTFDDAVVNQILDDVGTEEGESVTSRPFSGADTTADLPLLQLTCEQLWKQPSVKRSRSIKMSLYVGLGGKQGILDTYLRSVMPTGGKKYLTAQMMRFLAPPDRHKIALSAKHLASITGSQLDEVRTELERLSRPDLRVLRTRAYESETLYELGHDSLIRIIEPWRDRALRDQKFWRWARGVGGTAAVVVVVGAALAYIKWQNDREIAASESRFKVSSLAYRAQSDALGGDAVSALIRAARAAKNYQALEDEGIANDVSLTTRQTFVQTFRSATEVYSILFREDGLFRAVAFHPSEPLVVYGGSGGQIMISSVDGIFLRSIPACKEDNILYSLAFSPTGSLLAAGCEDGTVSVWNTGDWRQRSRWKAHEGRAWVVRFNRDGTQVASGGKDNKIMLMRLTDDGLGEKEPIELNSSPPLKKAATGQIWSLATSPIEDKFVAGDGDGNLWLCDLRNNKNLCAPIDARDPQHSNGADATLAIAFSQDGKMIATGHTYGAVWLWDERLDLKTRKKVAQLPAFIYSVAFIDLDGKISLAFGADRLWEVSLANEAQEPKHLPIASDEVYALSFDSPTGLLAAATRGGYVALVSTRDRQDRIMSRLPLGSDSFESCPPPANVVFDPLWVDRRRGAVIDDREGDTRLVVARCEQLLLVGVERDSHGEIRSRVMQTLSAEQVRQGQVQRVAASAAKRRIATLGEDGSVKFWRLGAGDMLVEEPDLALDAEHFTAKGFGAVKAEHVLLSADGEWLICSFGDVGSLLRVDLRDGARKEKVYPTPIEKIFELAFSADGKLFAAGGASKIEGGSAKERRVVLWDFSAGDLSLRDRGSKSVVAVRELAMVSDRDGKPFVAVAVNDGQIMVWDANTPNAASRCAEPDCRTLRADSNNVVQFAFSPKEALLAAADTMGRITLWDTGSWEMIELAPRPEQAKAKVGFFGFEKNGAFLLSGAKDLNVWDLDIKSLRAKACDILGAGNADAAQRLRREAREACE